MANEVEWLKAKHRALKPRGRYGAVGDHNHPRVKRVGNRMGLQREPEGVRVLVIDGKTGKRRWRWE
jgi:hypothetical protein